jgi:sugar phosphate permease
LGGGFRILFRDRPWQPFLLCAYITFFGHVVIGNVIDTDHWRHFYVLLGIIWGCIALEAQTHAAREEEEMVGAAGFEPTTP